jgi:hypothetical protein
VDDGLWVEKRHHRIIRRGTGRGPRYIAQRRAE